MDDEPLRDGVYGTGVMNTVRPRAREADRVACPEDHALVVEVDREFARDDVPALVALVPEEFDFGVGGAPWRVSGFEVVDARRGTPLRHSVRFR